MFQTEMGCLLYSLPGTTILISHQKEMETSSQVCLNIHLISFEVGHYQKNILKNQKKIPTFR